MAGGFSIRLVAVYLITCCLLLAQGAADDNKSELVVDSQAINLSNQTSLSGTTPNTTVLNPSELYSFDFNSLDSNSKTAFADLANSDGYYDYDPYAQIQNEPEVITLAFSASDLNSDNATDLLVMKIRSDPYTSAFDSEIFALSGADGSTLWVKEYPGSLVFATAAGDLNGDSRTDFMVNEILAAASFIPCSSLSALDGTNGVAIWNRPQMLAMTFAYPVHDINGDNASEFLAHIFGIDSMNNSIFTSIARLSGANGTKLDERIFSGALAIEYPAGNYTCDLVQDSIAAIYRVNASMSGEIEQAPMEITSTMFEARDGQEHNVLWNQSFAGLALAVPGVDLTGDGIDELIVYIVNFAEGNSMSTDLAVLSGSDGDLLWRQSFAGSMVIASAGPDLTGEGQLDLIIYKLGESNASEVLAVKGDDGEQLWGFEGMIFIPRMCLASQLLG